MPRNVKTIEIDGKKLREIFKERALSLSEVSVALGLEQGYFSKQTIKGRISLLVAVALETRFGIPRNLYEIVPEPEVQPEPEVRKDEVLVTHDLELNKEVAQQLYRIIYSATYEAMKKALEG